ncbi:uncharacterized protein H6S33_010673 [Morchella sextelata]|uniref:uncharacterized protein n=1 Tax=Morchella sextelata TaxID=1174677 RepID=UPI001D03FB2E|nr:uncharacterized protein H6S33_010673 [Morchella sextelata]KAH0611408.1 hypothetical protein H6S33_010673 [Morchella sextelata]
MSQPKMGVLDLEQQLLSYASYHHNPHNILIHLFGVPGIMFTGFLLATNTPSLLDLPYIPLNLGGIGSIVFAVFYILMEPVAGLLFAPLIAGMMVLVNHLTATYGATAVWWAWCGFLGSWVVQFIGHGVFEKRAPAILDNPIQPILLAPFFVWFEILFYFGYRPELQARIEEKVVLELKRLQDEKASKDSKKKA